MKKAVYLFLSIILWVLLSFLLHAAIEIAFISLLVKDFARYSLGFSWSAWLAIHAAGTVIFLMGGVIFGYFIGQRWWRYVYVEKKYRGCRWAKKF